VDPVIGVAGAVLTLIGVIVSAVVTRRGSDRKLKTDSSQQMIDQLQEEIRELRAERTKDRERDDRRYVALERTVRIQGDYIGSLRRHIADGHPPPPPPFPEGLIT
jgi:hypothetical protein